MKSQRASAVPNSKSQAAAPYVAGVALAAVMVLAGGYSAGEAQEPSSIKATVFSCDATPAVGDPMAFDQKVVAIDAPLLLKGIVLEDKGGRYVICALDWVGLGGTARDSLRKKLAEAADTPPARVTVHCTHTHSSPTAAQVKLLEKVADRSAAALKEARGRMRPVTHVGLGKAKVEQFASNRRVQGPDNKILVRYSSTKGKPELREHPEGLIDPWLRTITLFDGSTPLVRMHYYASHPQSFYLDGRVHPETVGWAREKLEKEEGVPQLYFTGCGGNIAAGKYNDGTPEARARLIERLHAGMKGAVAQTRKEPIAAIVWKTVEVEFAPGGGRNKDKAAVLPIDLVLLRLGPVDIAHLPGEPFVEYQLYAQQLKPDRFVAVAGYGDGSPGYICTDLAHDEGGYEPTAARVGPPSERILKDALAKLLR